MSTFAWPTNLIPQQCGFGSVGAGVQFKSPYNGTVQSMDFVAERLVLSVTLPPKRRSGAGEVEAFLFKLRGGNNRVLAYHFGRPAPRGTMRGTPVLTSTVTRGASSIAITTTPVATLKAGDMIGLGSHLLQVADDATATGAGAMTVNILHRIRETVNAGTSIVWDKPTAQFVMLSRNAMVVHAPGMIEGVAFDLEEIW